MSVHGRARAFVLEGHGLGGFVFVVGEAGIGVGWEWLDMLWLVLPP